MVCIASGKSSIVRSCLLRESYALMTRLWGSSPVPFSGAHLWGFLPFRGTFSSGSSCPAMYVTASLGIPACLWWIQQDTLRSIQTKRKRIFPWCVSLFFFYLFSLDLWSFSLSLPLPLSCGLNRPLYVKTRQISAVVSTTGTVDHHWNR